MAGNYRWVKLLLPAMSVLLSYLAKTTNVKATISEMTTTEKLSGNQFLTKCLNKLNEREKKYHRAAFLHVLQTAAVTFLDIFPSLLSFGAGIYSSSKNIIVRGI